MLYYTCPECSRESPFPDDQANRAVKCPHCGMLGMAYGVSIRKVPDAKPPEVVISPPPTPEAPSPPQPEPPPKRPLEAPQKARPKAPSQPQTPVRPEPRVRPLPPELEPIEPEAHSTPTPETHRRQEVPVRRVEPYMGPVAPPPLHPASIASLGLALIGVFTACCGIGGPIAIAAIVTGAIALSRISQQPGMFSGPSRSLAKIGIAVGFTGAVIALLWLLGTFASALR